MRVSTLLFLYPNHRAAGIAAHFQQQTELYKNHVERKTNEKSHDYPHGARYRGAGGKKSELEKQLGENYKPVSEVEKVRAARDNYKAQLNTAQETLKGFEGVDVNELQGRISTLQNDLAAQKTAFEQQISDMEFNSMLEDAIGKAGARSVKPARE